MVIMAPQLNSDKKRFIYTLHVLTLMISSIKVFHLFPCFSIFGLSRNVCKASSSLSIRSWPIPHLTKPDEPLLLKFTHPGTARRDTHESQGWACKKV